MNDNEFLFRLVSNDTATNIVQNVHLDKNVVSNSLNTLVHISAVTLTRVEGGVEFLNKYLSFRGIDSHSGYIFLYMLNKGLLTKEVGKIILVDIAKLKPEERRECYPKNTTTISYMHTVISTLQDNRVSHIKLFEFLLSLEDNKEALKLYSWYILSMFNKNYLDEEHMRLLLSKYSPDEEVPRDFKLTTVWFRNATKLTEEHLNLLFTPLTIYNHENLTRLHTLIIEHPKLDPNDNEFMDAYLTRLERNFHVSKSVLDRLVPLIRDETLRNKIMLKFYLYILYPEKYPEYDRKNQLCRLSSCYFDVVTKYFCEHLPTDRVDLQRYDWFVRVAVSRTLSTFYLHSYSYGWEILEILIPKYRTIFKLRELVSKLIQGHACRNCEERLVKLYG